ncbi:hypothetical protein cypCar_00050392, partial [Cyprinus carpio]
MKNCIRNLVFCAYPDVLSLCYSYQHIVDYIDTQFESYLQEELKIKRSLHNYHDSRIHACLYFIAPSGHSLKSLDLVTMKKLDSKVRLHFSLLFPSDVKTRVDAMIPDLLRLRKAFWALPLCCDVFMCFRRLNTSLWFLCIAPLQVNIIPVIAKADTISKSELHRFKIKIMSELVSNGVQIYQFPIDDETVAKINTTMN